MYFFLPTSRDETYPDALPETLGEALLSHAQRDQLPACACHGSRMSGGSSAPPRTNTEAAYLQLTAVAHAEAGKTRQYAPPRVPLLQLEGLTRARVSL